MGALGLSGVTLCYSNSFDKFTIPEDEYNKILLAIDVLRRFDKIHELYQIVFETVLEFENEHSAIINSLGLAPSFEFSKFRRRLNVKMLTVLTAVRAFSDHSHKLILEEPRLAKVGYNLRSEWHSKKETSFEFGFMELIRNIAQHHILPIRSISISIRNPPETESGKQEVSIPFKFSKEEICGIKMGNSYDTQMQKRISEKEVNEFDGVEILREYLNEIEGVFKTFSDESHQNFSDAISCISLLLDKYPSEFDDDMILSGDKPSKFYISQNYLDNCRVQRRNCLRLHVSTNRMASKTMT